jgi:transcription termination factor Rho
MFPKPQSLLSTKATTQNAFADNKEAASTAAAEAEKKKKKEEEEKKRKQDEEVKIKEYKEAKAAAMKEATKELDFVKNIFNYLREKDALTNDPASVFRIYRDCKDKAQNGLIWPKGD